MPDPHASDDDEPAPHPKKPTGVKKPKKRSTVIDLDSSSDDQVIRKKPKKINLAASLDIDTDIEEIETKKESPEEQLGKFL